MVDVALNCYVLKYCLKSTNMTKNQNSLHAQHIVLTKSDLDVKARSHAKSAARPVAGVRVTVDADNAEVVAAVVSR